MSQEEFEKFVFPLTENQVKIVKGLHCFFTRLSNVHCQHQFGVPVYYRHQWLFYLNPNREGSIELCFTNATIFSLGKEMLNFGNRQKIGSYIVNRVEQLTSPIFTSLVFEAIRIDTALRFKALKYVPAVDATSNVA